MARRCCLLGCWRRPLSDGGGQRWRGHRRRRRAERHRRPSGAGGRRKRPRPDELAAALQEPRQDQRAARLAGSGLVEVVDLADGPQAIARAVAAVLTTAPARPPSSPGDQDRLKANFDQLIAQLRLSELRRQFLRSRWLDQLVWVEGRANHNRDRYFFWRLITMPTSPPLPPNRPTSNPASPTDQRRPDRPSPAVRLGRVLWPCPGTGCRRGEVRWSAAARSSAAPWWGAVSVWVAGSMEGAGAGGCRCSSRVLGPSRPRARPRRRWPPTGRRVGMS
jgi:hypothetical protein